MGGAYACNSGHLLLRGCVANVPWGMYLMDWRSKLSTGLKYKRKHVVMPKYGIDRVGINLLLFECEVFLD